MITESFQVILKYVAPGQEDIVIQNVCKKLSFAYNDSEEKLDSMAEALNEAYQQQNDGINQLQILFLFAHQHTNFVTKEKLLKSVPGLTA
jgi:hypothetical protein